jgi:hypothetical protein
MLSFFRETAQSGFLSYCDFAALPLDIDAYF